MTLLFASVNASANDGGGGDKGGAAGASPIGPLKRASEKYVHSWSAFPPLTLKTLEAGEPQMIEVKKGRVSVVVFVASWCVPCQQLMPEFRRLAEHYKTRYTDIIYVFAHDAEPDAKAFAAFHKVQGGSFLGTAKVLQDFHQPDLPTVYVSDRYGWLAYRKLNIKAEDVVDLDKFLDLHTSF